MYGILCRFRGEGVGLHKPNKKSKHSDVAYVLTFRIMHHCRVGRFVAGAFLNAGRRNKQVLRLKYNPKRSAGVEISTVIRQGLNLNVHSHGTTFALVTEMTDMTFHSQCKILLSHFPSVGMRI